MLTAKNKKKLYQDIKSLSQITGARSHAHKVNNDKKSHDLPPMTFHNLKHRIKTALLQGDEKNKERR
jgi:hypothetical protein